MMSIRSLRYSLRFVLPLVVALALLAYGVVPLVDSLMVRWSTRDMDLRSRVIASTVHDPLIQLLQKHDAPGIDRLLHRMIQDERLLALGYCDNRGRLAHRTSTYPERLDCVQGARQLGHQGLIEHLPEGAVHFTAQPVVGPGNDTGILLIVHDMSYVDRRSEDTRKYVVILFTVLGIVTSLITVVVAQLSWRGWMQGVRAILRGEGILRPFSQSAPTRDMQTLVSDLRGLLRTLDAERRLADDATITWSPETLRGLLHRELIGERIIVVSNREPYIHIRNGEGIDVHRPASGLVTAVEPVMRACSGTWIAHGGGSADRDVVDAWDRVAVPPDHPAYSLRRIWLTKQEEEGYYYGFANEGLWPLCHIAHVRPIFRNDDWEQYVRINQRFADAVVKEAEADDPVVLVQDYHFALLPRMIRKALPRATIITFWHIPWPNAESFGICPWRQELLKGMLGSTILGFHTRFHCKNFLETVDRYLETRIEHESSTISRHGHLTMIESYPISIQWPPPFQGHQGSVASTRSEITRELGLPELHRIGLGVDRMDYTKGILERFLAVERMLELHPDLIGHFTFVQIAAPSRSVLVAYRAFQAQVEEEADRINRRFSGGGYPPIILKPEHHEPDQVNRYYRAADVCVVTSLHDGMNLVAKEYVAARDDERGALVLSMFTGAAHELHEALIVNPYHVEQTAEAIYRGLMMPEFEQQERMRSMRSLLRDFNVFRWAGRMLLDAARIRQREKLTTRIGEGT